MEIPYTNTTLNIFSPWTYVISFGSCLLYLVLISIIFPVFTVQLSSKYKNIFAKFHYTLLCLFSFISFIFASYHVIVSKEIVNWTYYICIPIPSWLRIMSIAFTISKIWEWFDTTILIGKGQSLEKIGFLHIYHHATTFLLFLIVNNFPGTEKSGMLFNGFIHTLMYYHFAFRLPKFLRPFITTLQILQLIIATYIWHITPDLCPHYEQFPRENFLEFILPYTLAPVYCLFFFKFFIEQYLLSSSKKVSSISKKEE